jgi:excinuclease UvrABC nuclease subunit
MLDELFDNSLTIDPDGQTAEACKSLPTCKGVLLFADDRARPIQLLIAANIRRTAAGRLLAQEPAPVKKRADISRITRKICYCSCCNDFASALAHYRIAKALYPDSYSEMMTWPRQTYVRIDPAAKWPFFSLTDKPAVVDGENVFGPFPSRKAANKFIQILQDAFCLCQRPALLAGGQNPASCPYLQMNTCPAPCVGKMAHDEYLQYTAGAISAAAGDVEKEAAKLKEKMNQSANARLFEQAQNLKKRLTQLELLERAEFRWTTKLPAIAVLHIDRSAKIDAPGKRKKVQTYAAFLIKAGHIGQLGDFTIDEPGEFYKSLLAKLAEPACSTDAKQLAESLALLAWHLYRSRPSGIWLNCSNQNRIPKAEEITNSILERFE